MAQNKAEDDDEVKAKVINTLRSKERKAKDRANNLTNQLALAKAEVQDLQSQVQFRNGPRGHTTVPSGYCLAKKASLRPRLSGGDGYHGGRRRPSRSCQR